MFHIILQRLGGDKVIWTIVFLLALFSVLAVYSSTGTIAYKLKDGNTEWYVIKHIGLLAAGLALMYLCYLTPYIRYNQMSPVLLVMAVPLLIFTLMYGVELNDARRWVTVPVINLTFQSSDFAKLALIIYVARSISAKQEYIKDFNSAFLPIIVPVIIICTLIAPSDLSTAILLLLTCLLLMFMGRVAMKYIFLLIIGGVFAFSFLLMIGRAAPDIVRVKTWENRMQNFIGEGDGKDYFQVEQAKIAISEGGLFGVGPGNSTTRNRLPHPYSDYIYAIIIEEYGLLGGGVVILLYLMLFFRCVRLVTKSPKAFGAMVALGLSLSLVLQAFMNMAVVVNLVPVTGLTLPLVSMGGTSLLFTCVSIGIILSVSRYIERVT